MCTLGHVSAGAFLHHKTYVHPRRTALDFSQAYLQDSCIGLLSQSNLDLSLLALLFIHEIKTSTLQAWRNRIQDQQVLHIRLWPADSIMLDILHDAGTVIKELHMHWIYDAGNLIPGMKLSLRTRH